MASDDPTRDSSGEAQENATLRPGLLMDGRYKLLRPLGEGGMGTVWVARQIALQRDVAIKSLRVTGTTLKDRLRQEALALAAIHHPSVVQVFDLGEMPDGMPYIVMELIEGESLAERLEREGPLEATEAVSLVIPLLEGLAVAHAAGVVHRDVKPENVLLASSGAGTCPKLVDFGIARLASSSQQLTRDGAFVGTPAFMAPEQIRGQSMDARVDVWGAAALLYSLMTGRPPFAGADLLALLRQVVEEPPSFPRSARGLDGKLWRVLMDSMRKSADDRTPSVVALRRELLSWLEGSAISSPRGQGASRAAAQPVLSVPMRLPMTAPMTGPRRVEPGGHEDTSSPFDALIRQKLGGA